jgi:aminoglycoside 6'-N-acetyltransferase
MGNSARYTFRPAALEDLSMLRRWLETPEVVRWWGVPEEQFRLLQEDLNEPLMAMEIVLFDGVPFAYAQHYDVRSWPQAHFASLPPGSRAIDAFIGEAEMLGRGHGSAFLRLLAERLRREGVAAVAIDPDVANVRAQRAYARAGFCGDAVVETAAGPAVLMVFEADVPRTAEASQ